MMFGLGLCGLGLRAGGEVAPPPEPVTTAFPYAQAVQGFYGPLDTVTNAARLYIVGASTVWFGRIKGSAATLSCLNPLDKPTGLAPFTISVDGGAYVEGRPVAGVTTLFTGLSDDWHTVSIRADLGFGATIYLPQTGTLMTVTGVSPALDVLANKVHTGAAGVLSGGPTGAAVANVNFTPRILGVGSDPTVGQGVNALAVRTAATKLHIVTESTYVAVSIDGAAPTYYNKPLNQGVIVPCDGVQHDYYIWCNGVSGTTNYDAFSIGADAAMVSIGAKRLHHFGHSIVHGIAATSTAHTDMARTAARKGYLFGNLGVSGNTIQTLLARMTATLARLTVTSSDVAVLDIGRNDIAAGFDASDDTDFQALLAALVAKGYGKILVLGQMTEPVSGFAPEGAGRLNEDMAAAVAATSNSAILYLSRASYAGIDRPGGTHPSDAGYVTMDGLNVALIDLVLTA